MISGPAFGMKYIRDDDLITRQQIRPGTVRRVLPYFTRHRWAILFLLSITAVDSAITVVNPVLLGFIVDDGILRHRVDVVVALSLAVAGLAVLDALATYVKSWYSTRIGEGLVYELRTSVFRHVQRQPLAFFTRTQTGALVSRLNNDVNEAQRAVGLLLYRSVSTLMTLALVLAAMFYLSWQISLVALAVIPLFVYPGKIAGSRQQRLTREQMQLGAELATMTSERSNVAGAMLAKLYGRPDEEADLFATRAGRMRDVAVTSAMYAQLLAIGVTLLAALTTALIYGLGGTLVIHGVFQLGTLVALITLITRLYGPINQVSGMQVNFLTALVSFDRVFEVLDLRPLITERPGAYVLPAMPPDGRAAGAAPPVEFDHVWFRYPAASEISLPSLEPVTRAEPERDTGAWVLRDAGFLAPAGRLTALVGPSGAGKTTITHLVPRLYDPASGAVRIDGHDIRDLTLASLRATVGVVPQDAHLFHDTIRANLAYARPGASEREMIEACEAAQIWHLISALPDGLDTVAGDRGYRLSGGEKQRVALARLLLKAPTVVILDEATAHLDSESEVAVQRALKTALAGRTSLVIAHRLSTIREADQILVIDEGRIQERGSHDRLLAADGLYADLYQTQFAPQATAGPSQSG
jgi:ATP-binding cassette, subfamily B, bacterial